MGHTKGYRGYTISTGFHELMGDQWTLGFWGVTFSMPEESSSTIVVVPSRLPMILNKTNTSKNLIVLNVNAQAPLKLTTMNYSAWRLQFTSLLFSYDLLGFIDGLKPCPSYLLP